MLVPKSRNVDPEDLKNALFRLTDLETRFSLNMNVLDAATHAEGHGPRRGACGTGFTIRLEVLIRKSQHRLEKIDARLELFAGLYHCLP